MKLLSFVFLSGFLSTLQVANGLPSSDMSIHKRAEDIPALMASDDLDLKVYTYDADGYAKIKPQLTAISHTSPPRADFSLDQTFPGLKEFETTLGAPPKRSMLLLATPKGSNKVVGWFDFDLGKHYTDADFAASEGLMQKKTDSLLGLKWVHEDYRGITEGKGLLGGARGKPYNLNMAITEAGMQAIENDGHTKVRTVFATDAGERSGKNSGFDVDMGVGEMDMDKRPTWESKMQTLQTKLDAKAKAPAC